METFSKMIRTTGLLTFVAAQSTNLSCHAFAFTFQKNICRQSTAYALLSVSCIHRTANSSSAHRPSTAFSKGGSCIGMTNDSNGSALFSTTSNNNYDALPDDYPNLDIVKPAIAAIRKASRITTHLQPGGDSNVSGITKKDASPVTIGDFAAQAIVLNQLERERKDDIFIAEESSSNLSDDLSEEIMQVLDLCGFKNENVIKDVEELKRCIDLGQSYKENGELLDSVKEKQKLNQNTSKVWCLDPIDGTRGFLRGKREGGQYCVALALIEDGVPVVGILGCPNLPSSTTDDNYAWADSESEENNQLSRGCIFVASKGGGCYQLPLYPPKSLDERLEINLDRSTIGAKKVKTTRNDGHGDIPLSEARFCIGVEKYSDPEGKVTAIANKIHGKLDDSGDILHTRRMDSQVKYGVVARGGAEYVTRLPKKDYVEWIWDHASGRIVIEEAGGIQTDTQGKLIDYGLGAKMNKDVDGLLISCGGIFHDSILTAYQEQEDERKT